MRCSSNFFLTHQRIFINNRRFTAYLIKFRKLNTEKISDKNSTRVACFNRPGIGAEIAVLTQIEVAFPKTKLAQSTKYGHRLRLNIQSKAIIVDNTIITHSMNRGGSTSISCIRFSRHICQYLIKAFHNKQIADRIGL